MTFPDAASLSIPLFVGTGNLKVELQQEQRTPRRLEFTL
jgi:hypothetical protein